MTFHNFRPGALHVTQVHKIIYRHVPQGRLWVDCGVMSTLALCGPVALYLLYLQ